MLSQFAIKFAVKFKKANRVKCPNHRGRLPAALDNALRHPRRGVVTNWQMNTTFSHPGNSRLGKQNAQ